MTVRTRFAPSPTGFFHIGNLRTTLYSYALAKRHEGQFILRIEDTDRNRYVEGAEEYIVDVLNTFGYTPDESPVHGGEFAPYRQSERLEIYREYADKLIEDGFAYYCFLTSEELDEIREVNRKANKMFRSPFRNMDLDEARKRVENGDEYVIRFKLPESKEVTFEDGLQGNMTFNTNDSDEWVMIKSDGYPTYNFAVVIDDHLMNVSHVFRGFEFIPSIPKNVLLYEAFKWDIPEFFHLPVIMDPSGGKLSKRKGAVSVKEFLEQGYLVEAISNFLMLLGWSAPIERVHGEKERELFSIDEFIKLFDTKDLNKSNPVFNREKLLWFNQEYIKKMTSEDLAKKTKWWVENFYSNKEISDYVLNDNDFVNKVRLVQERAKTLVELVDSCKFFYSAPEGINWEIKQTKKFFDKLDLIKADILSVLETMPDNSSDWDQDSWASNMRTISEKYEIKNGDSFMVLRIAVVGSPYSPPLFEALQILGKEEVIERLK